VVLKKKRIHSTRRIVVAGSVAIERSNTDGRVIVAFCVAIERIKADCRVIEAGSEAEKRLTTLGGVSIRIVSVRCWAYGSSDRRKRKPYESQSEEKKTAPKRRAVYRNLIGRVVVLE
jgi:uncharacterized membrane protein YidH (DUF202 family)